MITFLKYPALMRKIYIPEKRDIAKSITCFSINANIDKTKELKALRYIRANQYISVEFPIQ